MAAHTPGPWHVTKGPAPREIRADDGPYIASVYDVAVTYGERNANARLIAAAPELLDRVMDAVLVLEAIRENWGDDHPGLLKTIDEELPPLRAAIAKAEGR